jgi:hypothetical protein
MEDNKFYTGFECKPCRASYNFWDGYVSKYEFEYMVNDKSYRAVFYPTKPEFCLYLEEPDLGHAVIWEKLIVSFLFLPNLTPQNISERLPTILILL